MEYRCKRIIKGDHHGIGYAVQVKKHFLGIPFWSTIKRFEDDWDPNYHYDKPRINFALWWAEELLEKLQES